MTEHFSQKLIRMNACPEAVEFARKHRTFRAAWDACERSDWMLWLLRRTVTGAKGSDEHRRFVFLAADCAEAAHPLIKDEWTAGIALAAIQTARAWAAGAVDEEEARNAADVACAACAAYAAYAAYAADAACAAYAAYAAYAAAAADVACAAYAAAAADVACAAYAARTNVRREQADLVRVYFPGPPVLP